MGQKIISTANATISASMTLAEGAEAIARAITMAAADAEALGGEDQLLLSVEVERGDVLEMFGGGSIAHVPVTVTTELT